MMILIVKKFDTHTHLVNTQLTHRHSTFITFLFIGALYVNYCYRFHVEYLVC